jgi:hypothetical protein
MRNPHFNAKGEILVEKAVGHFDWLRDPKTCEIDSTFLVSPSFEKCSK